MIRRRLFAPGCHSEETKSHPCGVSSAFLFAVVARQAQIVQNKS